MLATQRQHRLEERNDRKSIRYLGISPELVPHLSTFSCHMYVVDSEQNTKEKDVKIEETTRIQHMQFTMECHSLYCATAEDTSSEKEVKQLEYDDTDVKTFASTELEHTGKILDRVLVYTAYLSRFEPSVICFTREFADRPAAKTSPNIELVILPLCNFLHTSHNLWPLVLFSIYFLGKSFVTSFPLMDKLIFPFLLHILHLVLHLEYSIDVTLLEQSRLNDLSSECLGSKSMDTALEDNVVAADPSIFNFGLAILRLLAVN
ncbi:hypothetical protein KUTeg_021922 [Tegillarca granosa]|uniref:Uncharacterized protein n=1 Tax=Tegillarca granosa TaxID=220873 RepID=A0ABQ9EAX1_TEGGR|nr:hypothetical protein KUTeg_021922 [Tegillarca granosa]